MGKKKSGSIIELEKNIPADCQTIMLGISCGQSYHGRDYFEPLLRDYVVPYCQETGAKFFVMLFDNVQGKDLQMRGLATEENADEKGRELGQLWVNNNADLLADPDIAPHTYPIVKGRRPTEDQSLARWRSMYLPQFHPDFHNFCELSHQLYIDNPVYRERVDFAAANYYNANIEAMSEPMRQDQRAALKLSREFSINEFSTIATLIKATNAVELYPGDDHPALKAIRRGEVDAVFEGQPDMQEKYAPFFDAMKSRRFVRAKIKPPGAEAPFVPQRVLDFDTPRHSLVLGKGHGRDDMRLMSMAEIQNLPVPDNKGEFTELLETLKSPRISEVPERPSGNPHIPKLHRQP